MDIIYCAGGNKRLASIAIEEGFMYGARSDDVRKIRCDGLIDINWKSYDWKAHLQVVAYHKPKYAVVPDITNLKHLGRTIRLATQLSEHCEYTIVVPKIHNVVKHIPHEYVIGISVPTSYSGFLPLTSDLIGRKVHLLGGSPKQQRDLWLKYKALGIEITSADGNSHSRASDFGSFWDGKRWNDKERANIGKYEAFRKSCRGILEMWSSLHTKYEEMWK